MPNIRFGDPTTSLWIEKYANRILMNKIIIFRKMECPRTPATPKRNAGDFQSRKLRRRSKSVGQLCSGLEVMKSKITTKFNQFRTPQPVSFTKFYK